MSSGHLEARNSHHCLAAPNEKSRDGRKWWPSNHHRCILQDASFCESCLEKTEEMGPSFCLKAVYARSFLLAVLASNLTRLIPSKQHFTSRKGQRIEGGILGRGIYLWPQSSFWNPSLLKIKWNITPRPQCKTHPISINTLLSQSDINIETTVCYIKEKWITYFMVFAILFAFVSKGLAFLLLWSSSWTFRCFLSLWTQQIQQTLWMR